MNDAYKPIKCKECATPLKPGTLQCRKCHTWNVNPAAAQSFDDHVVRLSDATLLVVQRITTDGLVDHIFGGGIAETSVNLLAGEPGAGKTTLCLQLADIFAAKFPGRDVLYIANEQDPSELKATAERLQLKHLDQILIVKGMGGMVFDLGGMLTRFNPCFIILDSVTKWSGEDPELAVTICYRLKDYCVSLRAPAIVINQVTKDGDHAGLNKMQHAVDMCCIFELEYTDEDKTSSDTTMRRLSSTKNRNGPAPEEQFYLMTPTGLANVDAEPSGKLGQESPFLKDNSKPKGETDELEESEEESETGDEDEDGESEDEETEDEETDGDGTDGEDRPADEVYDYNAEQGVFVRVK